MQRLSPHSGRAFDSNPDGYGRASGSDSSKSTRAGAGHGRAGTGSSLSRGRGACGGEETTRLGGVDGSLPSGGGAGRGARGIKEGARRSGPSDPRQRCPASPGPVLFLARGRGAVAAGGFISCQPRRVFITNCQARSLILGVPHPHALWSLRDWVVSGNGGNVLGRKLGSPNRWKPVRFDRLPVKLVRPGSGLDRY